MGKLLSPEASNSKGFYGLTNRFITIFTGVLIMAQNCSAGEYRESIHAGSWYPGREKELKSVIQTHLNNARTKTFGEVYGLISPHAGYMYSGPVAAFAYKLIAGREYEDVIIIGPSHHYGFAGASIDKLKGRKTPLGLVEYDLDLAERIIKENPKFLRYEPPAHSEEHSVEIQIPFLQIVLGRFKGVEIVMGAQDYQTCQALAEAIVKAVKGRKVLIVASSDLSHYHPQKTAEELDNLVIEAVAKFDPEILYRRLSTDSCEACGGGPIIVAMLVAQRLGANKGKILMYATSGNITGDYSQVVGYLAAALVKAEEKRVGVDLGFSEEEKKKLKEIATKTIEAVVKGKSPPEFKDLPERLKEPYGVFVTINKHGNLRGCIGHISADRPLYLACREMARAAALEDPRFNPVSEKELPELEIEISVLTPLERVKDIKEIVIGRDGLVVRRGYYSGLLLPQVATEYGWDVIEFLEHTCEKAGLPRDAYKMKDTEVYRFSAQVF